MIQLTDPETTPLQQPLKRAAQRRNLGTAAIVVIAFSGGPFGVTWLAASSATTFVVLMLWRMKQRIMIL
jgi:hypothetical protein